AAHSLQEVLQVMDPDLGEGSSELLSVIGHDFAYVEHPFEEQDPAMRQQPSSCGCQDLEDAGSHGGSTSPSVLYVALSDGYQVVAFQMTDGQLVPQEDFYPLRHWGGKALVAVSDGLAYYDFADRWLPLQVFT